MYCVMKPKQEICGTCCWRKQTEVGGLKPMRSNRMTLVGIAVIHYSEAIAVVGLVSSPHLCLPMSLHSRSTLSPLSLHSPSPGGFPYPNIGNKDILSTLKKGHRMECPENCSQEM